jgi:hypothetical protein
MRQKLITLCQKSFEIALKKPNFSKWVRDRLLEEVKKNKERMKQWQDDNCTSCGQPTKFVLAPAWCTSPDEHEVKSI